MADVLNDPVRRRSWLLARALETQPLDRALELARTAEAFIAGVGVEITPTVSPLRSEEVATPTPEANRNPLKQRNSLTLASERREQLLERLAQERVMRRLRASSGSRYGRYRESGWDRSAKLPDLVIVHET